VSPIARLVRHVVVLLALFSPVAALAQTPAQRGRLIVTVADPSGAVVQDATVTVVGLDPATKAATLPAVKTTDKGTATFEGLVLGRYSIRAEFPGFELGLLRDIKVNRGDNKHVVVLPLKGLSDSVTVGPDQQAAAADRTSTFGTALTREQVDALSDDPTEMQQQLNDMAGPDAVIRVDSFEGQQLPPKSQIKSIHITRDQFAAENHRFEGLFIDIITQPGVGPLRGGFRGGFYDSALDGRNALIDKKGPAQSKNYSMNLSRSVIKNRADFNLSFSAFNDYRTPYQIAGTAAGRVADNVNLRTPSSNYFFNATFNYAVTKDQTIRIGVSRSQGTQDNLGVGGFNDAQRAYSSFNHNTAIRVQEAGPIGRRFFINTRFSLNVADSGSHSVVEAPTIIVNDQFTTGGAQVAGGRDSRNFSLLSDLDYVRGRNSWRAGVSLEGGHYRSDDSTNYLGTFTFATLDSYLAGQPRSYTQRIGNPLITYWFVQAGFYVQDDFRVSKSLTFSPGVRVEAQSHVPDHNNIAPRLGLTWAPFKNGKTTLRGSWGIFYDWLSAATYEQTLRVDGTRQRELDIFDPSYPDPGTTGILTATNRYLLASSFPMVSTNRMSAGISQQLTKTFSVGGTYVYGRGTGLLVGENLNAPVNGVRQDPAFANIIEAAPNGRSRQQSLSFNANLYTPTQPGVGPNAPGAPRFVWKRGLSLFANLGFSRLENNTDGAFSAPFDPTLATEWGPALNDVRRRASLYIGTGALKNFFGQIGVSESTGTPINIRTGYDDNGDLIFNDRPPGVGRNSARGAGQWNVNGYFNYSIGFGQQRNSGQPGVMIMMNGGAITATTMAAQAAPRYRVNFSVNMENLTNHANLTGYSGIMTSQYFLQPTQVVGVRRITFNIGVSF
jgi:hypothetical protein